LKKEIPLDELETELFHWKSFKKGKKEQKGGRVKEWETAAPVNLP